jgi:hypothetical protein
MYARDRGFNIMSKDKFAIQIYSHALFVCFGIGRRKRIIIPIAIILSMFVIGGICWAAGAEITIISALPAAISQAAVIHSVPPAAPPPVPHKLERDVYYRYCMRCHGAGKMRPSPPNHLKYDVKSCLSCHTLGPKPKVGDSIAGKAMGDKPKPIPHSIEEDAYRDCAMCHGAGQLQPFPANHLHYAGESCTVCHKQDSRGSQK